MGVLPIQLKAGLKMESLKLKGNELVSNRYKYRKNQKSDSKEIEINIFDEIIKKNSFDYLGFKN